MTLKHFCLFTKVNPIEADLWNQTKDVSLFYEALHFVAMGYSFTWPLSVWIVLNLCSYLLTNWYLGLCTIYLKSFTERFS